jgi:hypothetical protein
MSDVEVRLPPAGTAHNAVLVRAFLRVGFQACRRRAARVRNVRGEAVLSAGGARNYAPAQGLQEALGMLRAIYASESECHGGGNARVDRTFQGA